MRYKFQYEKRLVKRNQFKQLFRTARRLTIEFCSIYYCDNNLEYPRLGVIVPKKNVNRATQRNYLKRIVREFFRLNQNQLKPVDLLVIVNEKGRFLMRNTWKQELIKQLGDLVL
jgi:ribonuclease P protein component